MIPARFLLTTVCWGLLKKLRAVCGLSPMPTSLTKPVGNCCPNNFGKMKFITAKPEHRKKALSLIRSLNVVSMEPIYHALNNRKVKIAIKGKKVLGVIVFTPRRDSIHIEALVIRATNRQQGIGKKLVKEIIKMAKRQRKNRVSLATAFLYNAKEFYEKCGFYRTRTWEDAWSMSRVIE